MEWFDAIYGRRSIRQYTAEQVEESHIETLLRAAMAAPSAGNQQPWRFVVVSDESIRTELAQATPYSTPVGRAPLALAICGDVSNEKHPGYWVQDCSAAMQNLLIAVHGLGLGAVWIGVHPIAERVANVQRILSLPEHIIPLGLVAVGHPAEEKPPAERFDPGFVHRERWTGSAS